VGKYIELVEENGWEYIRRVNCHGAAIVLVYHKDRDEYMMVEQYRPPVKCRVLEFPAGLMDEGEKPIETAVRELYEETGVVATQDDIIDLGEIFSGVGITSEMVYLFAVEIDSNTQIDVPELQGAEVEHDLQIKWVKEKDIYSLKAAKVLSIFSRYLGYRDAGIMY
jgi:ADP-ribose pyrophosphatase